METSSLIEVTGLRIQRGSFLLDVPGWTVKPGQVIGLVGPNGAGKTTLLEALAGLRPVSGGAIRVFGKNPHSSPVAVRSSLGFMSDDMPLFALKINKLLRVISGYYPTWDRDLVEELLTRFKLDPNQKVHHLSKGQGTRIRLLVAMAFRPRLLLLDEPASGLDLAGRHSLLESVLDVVRDPNRSVIISSHGLQDVERVSDRLLVLNEGRVEQVCGGVMGSDSGAVVAVDADLDFGTVESRNYLLLSPMLKQVFFVGDGRTTEGEQQKVVIPEGATRLYLGTMDSWQWTNNIGELKAKVTDPCGPTSIDRVGWTAGKAWYR